MMVPCSDAARVSYACRLVAAPTPSPLRTPAETCVGRRIGPVSLGKEELKNRIGDGSAGVWGHPHPRWGRGEGAWNSASHVVSPSTWVYIGNKEA